MGKIDGRERYRDSIPGSYLPKIKKLISLDKDSGCWNWNGTYMHKTAYLVVHRGERKGYKNFVVRRIMMNPLACETRRVRNLCGNWRCVNTKHQKIQGLQGKRKK